MVVKQHEMRITPMIPLHRAFSAAIITGFNTGTAGWCYYVNSWEREISASHTATMHNNYYINQQ